MPTVRQFPTPDTTTPLPKLRKDLSAPGLLRAIRGAFATIDDTRRGCTIPLVDALMSGLAVFGLKYPSLLQFDLAYHDEARIRGNLQRQRDEAAFRREYELHQRLREVEILWRRIKYAWLPFDAYQSYDWLKYRLQEVLDGSGTKFRISFA